MKKLVFAAVAAAFLATPALAADSPAAGTWAVEAKTDFGTFKSDWTVAENGGAWTLDISYAVTVDGDTMTGTANSDFGPIPIAGTRK